MFSEEVYLRRRNELMKKLSGFVLLPGNDYSPVNYPANVYPFRQDSTFLYFIGINRPELFAVLDCDNGKSILFGDEQTEDDRIWSGGHEALQDLALKSGISEVLPKEKLEDYVSHVRKSRKPLRFLPQYRCESRLLLSGLLRIDERMVNDSADIELIGAVVDMRSVKEKREIEEIEEALSISKLIHLYAMRETGPGLKEQEIVSSLESIVKKEGGSGFSFPPIFTRHGEILHNESYAGIIESGDLIVHDSGVESMEGYASDVTRTFPVGGKFSGRQADIYQIVLSAQQEAINSLQPGVLYRDIHFTAARVITRGLIDLGLLNGDVDEIVNNGAHALFFPHGLGHMLGLDVHDMEGLGEDYVGYTDKIKRSKQFGLAYLRLARELQPGFVLTVEPGIYFIPALITKWKAENKFSDFIRYDRLEEYLDFGGIRIEDDVLITDKSYRILGPSIPKSRQEIEEICSE